MTASNQLQRIYMYNRYAKVQGLMEVLRRLSAYLKKEPERPSFWDINSWNAATEELLDELDYLASLNCQQVAAIWRVATPSHNRK